MGFNISAWFNDPGIKSTTIVVSDLVEQANVTKKYGDAAFEMNNFTGTATFTAEPADGYKFKQWVYRIGGDSGAQLTSTDNPFRYRGADHGNATIIIRAESEVGVGTKFIIVLPLK